jgi:uncharacterized membrane protein
MIGIVLIVIGLIGTIWGGVTYVKDRDTAHLGPIHVTTEKKGHVSIPPMAGVAALVVGGLLVFMSTRSGKRVAS